MINAIVLIIVSCNGIWHVRLELTNLPLDKMAAFSQTTCSNAFFNENIYISNKISLNYIPWGPIDNILALVQIIAWRRPGDKTLSEPMLTQFPDAYMRHQGDIRNPDRHND